jgi:hypothetical protein
VVSNPAGGIDVCVLSGRILFVGLIARPESPTYWGLSGCDHEASIMCSPLSTRGCLGHSVLEHLFKVRDTS